MPEFETAVDVSCKKENPDATFVGLISESSEENKVSTNKPLIFDAGVSRIEGKQSDLNFKISVYDSWWLFPSSADKTLSHAFDTTVIVNSKNEDPNSTFGLPISGFSEETLAATKIPPAIDSENNQIDGKKANF